MIRLFETARGDFAPASSLSADEAIDAYRRRWLSYADIEELSEDAAFAIYVERVFQLRKALGEPPIDLGEVIVEWGVKSKTRAQRGRA
jgi:hypothetical protein